MRKDQHQIEGKSRTEKTARKKRKKNSDEEKGKDWLFPTMTSFLFTFSTRSEVLYLQVLMERELFFTFCPKTKHFYEKRRSTFFIPLVISYRMESTF